MGCNIRENYSVVKNDIIPKNLLFLRYICIYVCKYDL